MTLQQLIPDFICLLIVSLFLVMGAVRGMLRTLSGLLTWLISLWGAKLIADAAASDLADWLTPRLQPLVIQRLAESMQDGLTPSSGSSETLGGLLALIPGVQELLEETAGSIAEVVALAVAQQVAMVIGWLFLFIVGFLLLKLLCRLALKLLDLLDGIPGLHLLNHIAGAGLGVLKGGLLIAVVATALHLLGVLPPYIQDETILLRSFILY